MTLRSPRNRRIIGLRRSANFTLLSYIYRYNEAMGFAKEDLKRPVPQRQGGSFTALSLMGFNQVMREEARKVLLGQSRWFSFDAEGVLHTLHPRDTPEDAAQQTAEDALLLDVQARPDYYRALIAELEDPTRPEKEARAITDPRIDALKAQIEALDPYRGQIDALQSQIYTIADRYQHIVPNAAALEAVRGDADYIALARDMAALQEMQKTAISVQDARTITRLEWEISEMPAARWRLSKHLEHKYDWDAKLMQDRLKQVDIAADYDRHFAALKTCCEQLQANPYDPFCEQQSQAYTPEQREAAQQLRHRITMDAIDLELAAKLLPDAAARAKALEILLKPWPIETLESDIAQKRRELEDFISDGFTPGRRQILGAVMAFLARELPAADGETAQQLFNDHVSLVAHAEKPSVFMRHMRDTVSQWQDTSDWQHRERYSVEARLERLQAGLTQFERVAAGNLENKPSADELAMLDTSPRLTEEERWDPAALLRQAALEARRLRGDDYMRLHNSFPEAVNFIRASKDAEFLLDNHDASRAISDPASFFASPWQHVLGGAELTVDLHLLAKARATAQGKGPGLELQD